MTIKDTGFHSLMKAGQCFVLLVQTVRNVGIPVINELLDIIEEFLLDTESSLPKGAALKALWDVVSNNVNYSTKLLIVQWYLKLLQKLALKGVINQELVFELVRPKNPQKDGTQNQPLLQSKL